MSDLYWATYVSVLVITIVLGIMIWKIEKKNKARHRKTKRSKPKPSIDKAEIDLYGL